jgi:S1-C subfamily serine protease
MRAELSIAPDERPASAGADGSPSPAAGLRLGPLDATARERLDLPAHITAGAVVNAVEPGSRAAEAGLQAGDVILEVDNQPITGAKSFSDAWNKTSKALAVLVWREGRTFYSVIKR